MTEYEIDPVTWFSDRELNYTPKHFTISETSLTEMSKLWLINTLRGRYSVVYGVSNIKDDDDFLLVFDSAYGRPAFEDPAEAVMYELTWA